MSDVIDVNKYSFEMLPLTKEKGGGYLENYQENWVVVG